MNIVVTRETAENERREWHFYIYTQPGNTLAMHLAWYGRSRRETSRHKFKTFETWDRSDQRTYCSNIPREAIPLPIDVIIEATNAIKIEWKP